MLPHKINIKSTTPENLSLSVKNFLKKAGLTAHPVFLKFTPRSDKYLPSFCLNNCEHESEKTGAKIIYGWIIWQDKKANFIEAEFHSVIRENKKLVDITPRHDNEDMIMFVPDKHRKAVRVAEDTWDTWSSIKYFQGILEQTKPILVKIVPSTTKDTEQPHTH